MSDGASIVVRHTPNPRFVKEETLSVFSSRYEKGCGTNLRGTVYSCSFHVVDVMVLMVLSDEKKRRDILACGARGATLILNVQARDVWMYKGNINMIKNGPRISLSGRPVMVS
jgi:hypothetical protein